MANELNLDITVDLAYHGGICVLAVFPVSCIRNRAYPQQTVSRTPGQRPIYKDILILVFGTTVLLVSIAAFRHDNWVLL